jgi:predicted transposase YbfD/YdcC
MKRTDIINHLIKKNNYKRYLEIGVRNPDENLNKITVEHKDGVDPAGNCNYPIPSDDFFNQLDIDLKYDIIFIDGLHLDYQVEQDITNSLKHLNEGGTIVMHDCSPIKEEHQVEEYVVGKTWNGTTWKAYVKFRMTDENLSMCVVDTDHGVGIITKGKQTLYPNSDVLDFKLLDENRKDILNLITTEKFLNL